MTDFMRKYMKKTCTGKQKGNRKYLDLLEPNKNLFDMFLVTRVVFRTRGGGDYVVTVVNMY